MESNSKRRTFQFDYRVLLFGCLVVQLSSWLVWSMYTKAKGSNTSFHFDRRRLTAVDGLEAGARGTDPPDIKSRIIGDVPEYDWARAFDREKACAGLRNYTEKHGNASDERAQPLLIRHAVNWPALKLWNFSMIANLNLNGDVWVSPTFKFFYCDPKLIERYVRIYGVSKAPSLRVEMHSREAIMRMQKSSNYSSVVYPEEEEQYYFRVGLDDFLEQHVDIDGGPFSCFDDKSKEEFWTPDDLRLWVSPRGAISPLHFDKSESCLVQIRGLKRMLLWDKDDIDSLYPYPERHILRRRARVDPVAPDYEKYPNFQNVAARQAIVGPGDLLCFPSRWPHYTDSLDNSISVTIRW